MRTRNTILGLAVLVGASACRSTVETPTDAPVCGAEPWVRGSAVVTMRSATGPDLTLEDSVGSANTCPGVALSAASAAGSYYSDGLPFAMLWQHRWALPTVGAEEVHDGDFTTTVTLPSIDFLQMYPGFGPEKTALRIEVEHGPSPTGAPDLPCFSSDGVSIGVTDQPEASVSYYGEGDVPELVRGATATTSSGLAVVMGLPDGQIVEVVAIKPGCHVTAAFDHFTGRSLIQKGAVSVAHLRVSP